MDNWTVLTGTTSGIGLQILKKLLKEGKFVICGVRSTIRMQEVIDKEILETYHKQVTILELNLASFQSIESFVQQIQTAYKVDCLINNAGLYSDTLKYTKEGFEETLGVNYIGTVYLTNLMIPLFEHVTNPFVIHIASTAAFHGKIRYRDTLFEEFGKGVSSYAKSKALLLMMTLEMAKEWNGKVQVFAVHPGVVQTNIWKGDKLWVHVILKAMSRFFSKATPAADTVWNILTDPYYLTHTGLFLRDFDKEIAYSNQMKDAYLRKQIVLLTNKVIDLKKDV